MTLKQLTSLATVGALAALLSLPAQAQEVAGAPSGNPVVTDDLPIEQAVLTSAPNVPPPITRRYSARVVVRLEVDAATPGGLAIYGAHFGRYPVDPTVAFILR